jgi:hypothetical protein
MIENLSEDSFNEFQVKWSKSPGSAGGRDQTGGMGPAVASQLG